MSARPTAPVIVLSPHLDDAVVSAWHVLTAPIDVLIINVFAGVPPSGSEPTLADRLAGFRDSADLVRARHEEDREARGLVGRDAVTLAFIEDQYRRTPVSVDELRGAIEAHVPAAARVVAPAAIGGHPDHELVRDLGLAFAHAGHEVELYGDLPYIVRYGWPEWLTGVDPGPHLDVEAYWQEFLAPVLERGYRLERRPHDLGEEGSDRKLEAMARYATQFQQLNSGIVDRLRNPLIRRYEVSWTMA